MGSLATFKTTYLASAVLPTGQREQVAGLVYAVEQRVSEGASVTNARVQVSNKRASVVLHNAQATSSPLQGALAADFLGLDSA
jgi:hypothetical protein